jgi:hypothetical protein
VAYVTVAAYGPYGSRNVLMSQVLLEAAVGSNDPPDAVSVECTVCDWATSRQKLPPVIGAQCTLPLPGGLKCRALFRDGRCLPADVYEDDGHWRIVTTGIPADACE